MGAARPGSNKFSSRVRIPNCVGRGGFHDKLTAVLISLTTARFICLFVCKGKRSERRGEIAHINECVRGCIVFIAIAIVAISNKCFFYFYINKIKAAIKTCKVLSRKFSKS